MTEEEILKVINLLIGERKPHGSHGIDMDKIVPNVDLLGRIVTELICELNWTALDFENRSESSIQAVGEKARYWVDFIEVEILGTTKKTDSPASKVSQKKIKLFEVIIPYV